METRLVVTIDSRGALSGSKEITSALSGVRSSARSMTSEVDSSFDRLKQNLFSLRGAIATLGVGEFVRRSVQSFAEFEQVLVNVGKTSGIAGNDLTQLGDDIINMSKRVPVARNELLSLAQVAGQLGIEGNSNILKFTETMAKMGRSTNLAGEEGATAIARILNVSGESVDSVDRLGSALVTLGNASSATEAEIAHMTVELSKGTAQFHASSANLAGLGTTLKEFGQQAELARSSILRTFLALKSATDDGGQQLQFLGAITGQTGEQFKKTFQEDAFGAFLQFIKGLRSVIDQGGSAERTLEVLRLNGTEVNAVLPLLAVNFDRLSERIGQSNQAYKENTALNIVAGKAFNTFSSYMIIVKNNIADAARIIGEYLAPALSTLGAKLVALTNSQGIVTFAKALGGAFQVLANNIELVKLALEVLVLGKIIRLFTDLGIAVFATANMLRIGATAAIAQAAGLTAAAAAANLYAVGTTAVTISTRNVGITTKLAATGMFLLDTALSLVGIKLSTLSKGFGYISESISGGGLARAGSSLLAFIAPLTDVGLYSSLASTAVGALTAAFGFLISPIGIVVAAIAGLIALFVTFHDKVVDIGDLHASVGNILQATWNVTSQRISDAVSNAVSDIIAYFTTLLEPVRKVFNDIYNFSSQIFSDISDYIGGVVDKITAQFRQFSDAVNGIFTSIKDKIVNIFSGATGYAKGFINDVSKEANRLQTADDAAKNTGVKLSNEVFGPPAPDFKRGKDTSVSLNDVQGYIGNGGRGGAGGSGGKTLEERLKGISDVSKLKAQEAGLGELGKRLLEVDKAVQTATGGHEKLTAAQTKQLAITKQQVTENFHAEQNQERIKQAIEDTLTPQEKYNKAVKELTDLQPQTAQGVEAIRRKMAELKLELQQQDPVWKENIRLTQEFNSQFESTFKRGLNSVFKNGKSGFKDMVSGFKDLYFNMLTEIAARPIINFLLGKPNDSPTGRSGGIVSDSFGAIFGNNVAGGESKNATTLGKTAATSGASGGIGSIISKVAGGIGNFFGFNNVSPDFVGPLAPGQKVETPGGGGFFSNIFSGIGSLFSGGGATGISTGGASGGLFSSLFSGIASAGGGIGSFLGSAASGIGSLFGGGNNLPVVSSKNLIKPVLPGQLPENGTDASGGGMFSGLLDGLKGIFGGASGGGFLGGLSSLFGSSGGSEGLLGGLNSILGSAGGGGGFLGGFSSLLGGLFGGGGGGLGGMMGGGGGGKGGASSILGTIGGIVGNIFMPGVGGMAGSMAGNAIGGFFANGGSVDKRTPIVVGERGPELFIPPVNGEIISNEVLKKATMSPTSKIRTNILPLPGIIKADNDNFGTKGLPENVVAGVHKAVSARNFAGFFASGGSVAAGKPLVGGEKGTELFVPSAPANTSSKDDTQQKAGDTVIVHFNVHTNDATSFRRSQGQIASDAAQAIQRARKNL